EVIVRHDPARRRKVTCGLKLYVDGGVDRAVFFPQPGWMLKASRQRTADDRSGRVEQINGFQWDGPPERLPVNAVPIVEFLNLAGIDNTPEAEFEAHLASLDRVSYTVLNRLEASTMQAF